MACSVIRRGTGDDDRETRRDSDFGVAAPWSKTSGRSRSKARAILSSCNSLALFSYLFRFAAFHLAQRARWAAAIRLRAAADMVLRLLPSV